MVGFKGAVPFVQVRSARATPVVALLLPGEKHTAILPLRPRKPGLSLLSRSIVLIYSGPLSFFGRPRGNGRTRRPNAVSSLLMKLSLPNGLPVWVRRRNRSIGPRRQSFAQFRPPLLSRHSPIPLPQVEETGDCAAGFTCPHFPRRSHQAREKKSTGHL